jgi:hypothetical protein
MDLHRKATGRSAKDLTQGRGGMVTIGLPSPDEGIGRALRSVYCPVMQDGLPDDMLALLAQLDRH